MKHRACLVALLMLTAAVAGAASLPNGDTANDVTAALVRIAGLGLTGMLWVYWLRADSAQ